MVPPAYGGERNQIVLFKTLTWSRRYSWFLQRLKYNGKHTHTHIWLHLQCSRSLDHPFSASNTLENTITSLYLQCSRGLHAPYSASNTMEMTIIWLYLQCSRGLRGPSSASNTIETYEDRYNWNVPEIFMVPPAPTYNGKHNYICMLTMFPSVHAPSSVSNTMETYNGKHHSTIYVWCSGGHHGASSASNNEHIIVLLYLQRSGGLHGPYGTHNEIVIFTVFLRSSWSLQHHNQMDNTTVIIMFAMFWWSYGPSSASNTMETHTIITSLCWQCSRVNHRRSSTSNTFENAVISLHLQCACRGLHGPSRASNTMKNISISFCLQCSRPCWSSPALKYNGTTIISLHLQWERYLQCSAGLHSPFTASNTMETQNRIIIFAMLQRSSWCLQRSNTMLRRSSWSHQSLKNNGTHSNILIFKMFRRSSWSLQRIKHNGKHNYIVILKMFRRSSWSLQRVKYNGKQQNTVRFTMFRRFLWLPQRLKHDGNTIASI